MRRWARGMRSTQPCEPAAGSGRGQCHRLLGGLLDAVSGEQLADPPGCTRCSAMPRRWPPVFSPRCGPGPRHPVVAQAGDGGTVDIGLGPLSGMFERNDDVLFICYDNEAYMNTGVQRSGATPPAARTATTQAVGEHPGNVFGRARTCRGSRWPTKSRMSPRPRWRICATSRPKSRRRWPSGGALHPRLGAVSARLGFCLWDTILLARLAQQSGLFPVFEAEFGEVTAVSPIRRRVPVTEYLQPQRYAHLLVRPGHRDHRTHPGSGRPQPEPHHR